MDLMKGIGLPFPAEYSSCSSLEPKLFKWTSGDSPIHIYIDDKILSGLDNPIHPFKYGWLCESREISIDIYRNIVSNLYKFKSKFVGIFTCDESLLSLDPLFIYVPPGSNLPWTKPHEMAIYEKSKICSMIASPKTRTYGHHKRLEVAAQLRDKLDLFGGAHGSPRIGDGMGPKGDWWRSKLGSLKDYMFSVVFENGVYDKYYTEKITDCFATGTIPIYWGTKKVTEDFNEDGIIFYDDFKGIESLDVRLYNSKFSAIEDNFNRVKSLMSSDDLIYIYIKNKTS